MTQKIKKLLLNLFQNTEMKELNYIKKNSETFLQKISLDFFVIKSTTKNIVNVLINNFTIFKTIISETYLSVKKFVVTNTTFLKSFFSINYTFTSFELAYLDLVCSVWKFKKFIEDESFFYSIWIGTVIRVSAISFYDGYINFECFFNRFNTLSFVFSRYGLRFWVTGFITFGSAFVLLYALCRALQTTPSLLVSFEEFSPLYYQHFLDIRKFLYETQDFLNDGIKYVVKAPIYLFLTLLFSRIRPDLSYRIYCSFFDPEKLKPHGINTIKTSPVFTGKPSSEAEDPLLENSSEIVESLPSDKDLPYAFDDWGIVALLALIGYLYFDWGLDKTTYGASYIHVVEDPTKPFIQNIPYEWYVPQFLQLSSVLMLLLLLLNYYKPKFIYSILFKKHFK